MTTFFSRKLPWVPGAPGLCRFVAGAAQPSPHRCIRRLAIAAALRPLRRARSGEESGSDPAG